MTGKGRALVFISIAGAVLVPGIVLAFVFLHFWFALFASMFVALAIFGMVFGSRSPRRDRLNQLEAEAAKKATCRSLSTRDALGNLLTNEYSSTVGPGNRPMKPY